jgi:hypothetical protein
MFYSCWLVGSIRLKWHKRVKESLEGILVVAFRCCEAALLFNNPILVMLLLDMPK